MHSVYEVECFSWPSLYFIHHRANLREVPKSIGFALQTLNFSMTPSEPEDQCRSAQPVEPKRSPVTLMTLRNHGYNKKHHQQHNKAMKLGGGGVGPHIGNPALRQGKPGSGIGLGYGLRFKSQFGHFQVDYAINAFQQKTLYFGLSNLAS
ncbi:hypothetical protein FH972_010185 [Carpinus fangiana]|uniref:Bacterial surface antigen (D15) domain-containing protein n=1 Tax=Carpinus fangiana TaxID=176857 RepID=A0A660KPG8_9ROSI|nr:hypothetical protein FH972_010185 [Carpinus fangiana]